jgi:hypothetical protein
MKKKKPAWYSETVHGIGAMLVRQKQRRDGTLNPKLPGNALQDLRREAFRTLNERGPKQPNLFDTKKYIDAA